MNEGLHGDGREERSQTDWFKSIFETREHKMELYRH